MRFCPKRKYGKCGNTLCISHFSYCTIGAKDPPKPAAPIVRCCPKIEIKIRFQFTGFIQYPLKSAHFYTGFSPYVHSVFLYANQGCLLASLCDFFCI